ncbi:superoxide dismutase [bacterium]|nr:superoxide dismutase [Alphaproteobacteria bacterium]NDD85451.1 superoxide dismutase [bacterium]
MPTLSTKSNITLPIVMYTKVQLPYEYNALEPILSRKAVKEHYDFHYSNYTKGLNEAYLKNNIQLKLINILHNINDYPKEFRENGGGYINHSIFFQCLKPISYENPIPDSLKKIMRNDFGSVDEFMNYFIGMGKKVFGSGWVWWCIAPNGRTIIATTKNQDTPYSENLYPIFGIDVWEHSYYLDYLGDRLKYLNEIFKIVNWDYVISRIKIKMNSYV